MSPSLVKRFRSHVLQPVSPVLHPTTPAPGPTCHPRRSCDVALDSLWETFLHDVERSKGRSLPRAPSRWARTSSPTSILPMLKWWFPDLIADINEHFRGCRRNPRARTTVTHAHRPHRRDGGSATARMYNDKYDAAQRTMPTSPRPIRGTEYDYPLRWRPTSALFYHGRFLTRRCPPTQWAQEATTPRTPPWTCRRHPSLRIPIMLLPSCARRQAIPHPTSSRELFTFPEDPTRRWLPPPLQLPCLRESPVAKSNNATLTPSHDTRVRRPRRPRHTDPRRLRGQYQALPRRHGRGLEARPQPRALQQPPCRRLGDHRPRVMHMEFEATFPRARRGDPHRHAAPQDSNCEQRRG